MRIQNYAYIISAAIALSIFGCDIYVPQTTYTFAVSRSDYLYNYMMSHLKPFLEENGYEVKIIETERVVDANRLVAEGKADLTFVNNVSSNIVDSLGAQAQRLQTILPLTRMALLAFTRQEYSHAKANELFGNKVLGVEKLLGESHGIFEEMMSRARIKDTRFVQFDQGEYDVRLFFGSLYGKRATEMLDSGGWHLVSFDPDWLEFQTLSDPALSLVALPALPGDPNSLRTTTLASDAVLVGSSSIGENAVYELAETFFQKKMSLVRLDPIYRSISESIDNHALLYPLHIGTASYLRRDTPTFFERYSDTLALVLSIIVVIYSLVQTIQRRMAKIRKDRIDEYFLEFLDVRIRQSVSTAERLALLDDLFQRALVQMTNEKMDKGDFSIFSRLVQQEMAILRMTRNA